MQSQSQDSVSFIEVSSRIPKKSSSPSENSESQGEQEYTLTKKSKIKQAKKKRQQKNPIHERAKKQQIYAQKKQAQLAKVAGDCKNLRSYLRHEVQAKIEPIDPNSNGFQNSMNSYIQVSKSIEIYESSEKREKSLQMKAWRQGRVKKEHGVKEEHWSQKREKQSNLSKFFKCLRRQEKVRLKLEQQIIKPEDIKSYSESYLFIKGFLEEMIASKDIFPFSKLDMQDLMKTQGKRDYYHDYYNKISIPLSLSQLLELVQNGSIKNYHHFKSIFDQMLLNGRYYHMLRQNTMLMNNGQLLLRKFLQKWSSLLPDWKDDIDYGYKLVSSNKARIGSAKIEAELAAQYLDLSDEENQYRFAVMNRYLKKLCLEKPHQVQVIEGKLQSIIKRYPKDNVAVARRSAEQTNELPGGLFSQRLRKSGRSLSPKSSKSESGMSDNSLLNEAQFLEITPKEIEVDLFEQMKRLIIKELNSKKRNEDNVFEEFGQVLNLMYPHDDSEDFDIDDDSDDS